MQYNRMPFLKKVREVGFKDGMLTEFYQKRPSPSSGLWYSESYCRSDSACSRLRIEWERVVVWNGRRTLGHNVTVLVHFCCHRCWPVSQFSAPSRLHSGPRSS